MSNKIRALVNVHDTLNLPECKPDIEFVLHAAIFPHIYYTSTIDKKIIFRGYIDLCIEYVAKTCECSRPVYFAKFKLPFHSGVIEYCRIKPDCKVQLKAVAEYLKVTVIDCRTIDCVAVINVKAIQFGSFCENLPPHICIPFISQFLIFSCDSEFNNDAKPGDCQLECPPCHPFKSWDCIPCDHCSDPCQCHPSTTCDCMAPEHTSFSCSSHQPESCECMSCDKQPDTYYQDCCSRNISIGT